VYDRRIAANLAADAMKEKYSCACGFKREASSNEVTYGSYSGGNRDIEGSERSDASTR
jgi:hypothetical protein